MMKYIYSFIIISFLLISCGYPDIDNVPDFKNIKLTSDEINDYCSRKFSLKINIENCIKNYTSIN